MKISVGILKKFAKTRPGHNFTSIRGVRGRPRQILTDFDNRKTAESDAEDGKFREKRNNPHSAEILKDAATFIDLESPAVVSDHWASGLYPKDANRNPHDTTKYSFRPPELDPRETSIILFPGQGSQYVGMAKNLIQRYPKARELFDVAGSILRYDLLKLCLEGPKNELNKTIHSQPAVFVCSLAALERLKLERPKAVENCIATAGFSVGEYAALVLANALTFEDALKLVKVRAESMQAASEVIPSGMMTVYQNYASKLNLAMAGARQWVNNSLSQTEDPALIVNVANYLFTNCKVIGGQAEALKFIEDNAEQFKIRCKRLPVSGGFHTPLMRSAAEILREEFKKYKFHHPLINVHSNLDGRPYRNVHEIPRKLCKQVYLAVRWEQTMHSLYDRDFFATHFPVTYECGPGKHLGLMLKHTNGRAYASYYNVFDDEKIE